MVWLHIPMLSASHPPTRNERDKETPVMARTATKDAKNSSRVLISLPDRFLDEIDELAEEEQRTRSELIREALRQYIRAIDTRRGH